MHYKKEKKEKEQQHWESEWSFFCFSLLYVHPPPTHTHSSLWKRPLRQELVLGSYLFVWNQFFRYKAQTLVLKKIFKNGHLCEAVSGICTENLKVILDF